MVSVVPTITAVDAQSYREQMARVAPFAKRIHIDFSDGEFSPVRLVNLIQAYWPEGMVVDLHLMLKRPHEHIETIMSLKPDLVIIQAEAEGDLIGMLRELRAVGLKTGVALLQQSQPSDHKDLVAEVDHVLIFSGDLGHFGGTADVTLMAKINQVRAINATAEIGWDGGINSGNATQLALGGVEVLNVGGAIHKSLNAKDSYNELIKAAQVAESQQQQSD